MATLLELTAEIVTAHASSTQMTSDELLKDLQQVYTILQALEAGKPVEPSTDAKPALTIKQAFKKDEVICMVCGKGRMKTITRHIRQAHDLKPGQYRKRFGIPSKQPLTAKSYSEARKKSAEERGLGDVLAKARETRAANIRAKKSIPVKKAAPAKKTTPVKTYNAKTAKKAK
jgi:predicted transcriptional regulator